jgi:hypothetical protein
VRVDKQIGGKKADLLYTALGRQLHLQGLPKGDHECALSSTNPSPPVGGTNDILSVAKLPLLPERILLPASLQT